MRVEVGTATRDARAHRSTACLRAGAARPLRPRRAGRVRRRLALGARARPLAGDRARPRVDRHRRRLHRRPDAVPRLDPAARRITCSSRTCSCCARRPADYFQPAVMISGGLSALGMAPWVSFLLWKPVAVAATFFAVRAYAHRQPHRSRGAPRRDRAGAVLRLVHGRLRVGRRARRPVPGLPLLGVHVRAAGARRDDGLAGVATTASATPGGSGCVPGLLGAGASLLHPWHGELLILVIVGGEAFMWALTRERPRATEADR